MSHASGRLVPSRSRGTAAIRRVAMRELLQGALILSLAVLATGCATPCMANQGVLDE